MWYLQLQSCSVTLRTGCATGVRKRAERTRSTGPVSMAPLHPLTPARGKTTRWAPALAITSTSSPLCLRCSRTQPFCWAESFNPRISVARPRPRPSSAVFSVSTTTCLAHTCFAWRFTSGPQPLEEGTCSGFDMATRETCGAGRLFTWTAPSLFR